MVYTSTTTQKSVLELWINMEIQVSLLLLKKKYIKNASKYKKEWKLKDLSVEVDQ